MSIMIPLPPKVFLSGESAESAAFRTLIAIGAKGPKPLADGLANGRIQLRSSLKTGRSFKKAPRPTAPMRRKTLIRHTEEYSTAMSVVSNADLFKVGPPLTESEQVGRAPAIDALSDRAMGGEILRLFDQRREGKTSIRQGSRDAHR